jgi:acyl-CoA thioesterase
VLTATAREHTMVGRNGIYDVDVKNQNGETIALFRGKSTRIKGHVVT